MELGFINNRNIRSNYKVFFMQRGGLGQFAAVLLNVMKAGKADYDITGNKVRINCSQV